MIPFCREPLRPARVLRDGERTTDVARDNARALTKLSDSPCDILRRKTPILPVCDRVARTQAVEIHCDVNARTVQLRDEALELLVPALAKDRAAPLLLLRRSIVGPGMNLEFARAFGATIPKDLSRPPTFKIPATPDADLSDVWQLKRAIYPATASPSWRPDIPVGMIVEGNDNERLRRSAYP